MCLSIPAKVVKKLGNNKIVIQNGSESREINASSVPDIKIGDWLLYLNNLAIKKISKKDASEIIELLEDKKSAIDNSRLDSRFKKIIETSKTRDLTKKEIIYLLKTGGLEKEALFSEANITRKAYLRDFICLHGIIEFSNYCKNNCFYCGLRKDKPIKRFRMATGEIVREAQEAVQKKGYKILILQSGEDYFYTDEVLASIIRKIKEKCRVFIIMSIGERGLACYKKLKQAGASGVLFRFETSNPALFKKVHGNDIKASKNLGNRLLHLKFMKELGFFIATGSIIGLPGQTIEDLADDVLMIKKWADMVSMGPFVPSSGTPFADSPAGDVEMVYKMIAVLRLLVKKIYIPVVTSLETLAGEQGRKKAFLAGANSLMINLTPSEYRRRYNLYNNRFFQKKEKNIWEKYGLFKQEESYKMLESRMVKEIKT